MSRRLIHGIAFATGFSMMGLEILGSRILAPVFGGTVQVWGALIAVFMGGLSLGYGLGGVLADRGQCRRDLAILLGLAGLLAAALSGYGPALCAAVGRLPLPTAWGALLASALLFLPVSICLGAISPCLVRLAVPDAAHLGRGAGGVFAVATLGSIAGTLAAAFYLIGAMGTARGMLVLSLPLFLAAAAVALAGRRAIAPSPKRG
jgi:MFS family permease